MGVDGINAVVALAVLEQQVVVAADAAKDAWLGLQLADFLALGGDPGDPNYDPANV